MNKKILLTLFCCTIGSASFAQQINRFNPDTIRTIVIDSVVNIRSHKLNAQDFIDAVLADTSFYQAFRNMKKYSFTAENYIYTYDKHNRINGKVYQKIRRTKIGNKNTIEYIAKRDSGNVYKKDGKYQLYTVNMFDYIFANAYKSGPGSGNPFQVPANGK